MSNLFILLKNSFINSAGINSLSKGIDNSKEKKKLLITTVTLLLIATVICFMSTLYSIALAIVLKPMGYLDLILIVAVLLDRLLNTGNWVFRTLVCYFYIANEGISLLENCAGLGLPIPEKLKDALAQLKEGEKKELKQE